MPDATANRMLGLVVGAAALGIGLAVRLPMLSAEDPSMDMTPQIAAAAPLPVAAFSLIGVCCGVIFRSQSAAVLVIVGTFVVEPYTRMPGNAACTSNVGLLTKNSSWSRWARQVSSSRPASGWGPVAFATTATTGPRRRSTSATKAVTAPSSPTSAPNASATPPASRIDPTTFSAAAWPA